MNPELTVVAPGPCWWCDHDPACGFASVSRESGDIYLCHEDDHSCYDIVTKKLAMGALT